MLTFSLYILQSDCSLERIKYLKKFVSYPVSRTAQIIVFLDVFLILEFFFNWWKGREKCGEWEERGGGRASNAKPWSLSSRELQSGPSSPPGDSAVRVNC